MGCDGWLRRHRLLPAKQGIHGFPRHQALLGEQNQLPVSMWMWTNGLVPKPCYPSPAVSHGELCHLPCHSSSPNLAPLSGGLKAVGMVLSPQGS